MKNLSLLFAITLGSFLASQTVAPDHATAQTAKKLAPRCDDVELLSSHPLSVLPHNVQRALRRAILPQIQALINDPGMGLNDAVANTVPLNAIQVVHAGTSVLYIVAWDDPSFGVNGFNWIVEDTPRGAFNISSPHASSFMGGFGVEVLGAHSEKYPELMIGSKGYAQGGGAEGEASCFRKVGHSYESMACPKSCQAELNDH